jgi:hypothetical protein
MSTPMTCPETNTHCEKDCATACIKKMAGTEMVFGGFDGDGQPFQIPDPAIAAELTTLRAQLKEAHETAARTAVNSLAVIHDIEAGQDQLRAQLSEAQRERDQWRGVARRLAKATLPFGHDDLCLQLGGNVEGNESPIYARNRAVLKLGDFRAAKEALADFDKLNTQ